jgi:hypothetical protein
MFHFVKKLLFGGINTMCWIKLFARTFGDMAKRLSRYNVIISKSKTLLELKGWFDVECDFIVQIPLSIFISSWCGVLC